MKFELFIPPSLDKVCWDLSTVSVKKPKIYESLNLYHNEYTARISIVKTVFHNNGILEPLSPLHGILEQLQKVTKEQFSVKTRLESWTSSLFIYCTNEDLEEILNCLMYYDLKKFTISIKKMPTELASFAQITFDNLPYKFKAQLKLTRSLAHRYKIFWPSTHILNKCSENDLQALMLSLLRDDQTNMPGVILQSDIERITKLITNENYDVVFFFTSSRYFYTNNIDILYELCLINPKFIVKIEKYYTLGEINEGKLNRNTIKS